MDTAPHNNVHAKDLAHHAVASGSDMISDSSCAKMEAMPSTAEPPFGPTRWNSQKPGHLFTLPTNPKLQVKFVIREAVVAILK